MIGVTYKRMLAIMPTLRCVQVGKRLRVTEQELARWQREQACTHIKEAKIGRKEQGRLDRKRWEELALAQQAFLENGGKIPRRKW